MKKFLSLLVAAVMLLSCIPAMAEAFPALDNNAAWDYIGYWYGVSGMDVMGDPTDDYPALELDLFLDGLGDLYLDDGAREVVGWYVEDGMVFLAHTVDNVPQADDIFAFAYRDETGRLVVDLMTVAVRCEQEGEEYGEVYWPEFDAEAAEDFIGVWAAVTYISEDMEVPVASDDEMILALNDNGTALSVQKDEEPYELRWYSDGYMAYVGETPEELAEIFFDDNGNIIMTLDAAIAVIMAPTENVPEVVLEYEMAMDDWENSIEDLYGLEDGMPAAQPIGAEGEPYFGAWQADIYGMAMILTLNRDGTCTMDMLGEVETAVWTVENGKAMVDGSELYIDGDGNLVMAEDGMVFTKAEDGAATTEMSDEELLMALLAAMAASESGEESALPEHLQGYVGTWHMCYISTGGLTGDMRPLGITGTFTVNEDGTAYMSGISDDEGSLYEEDGIVRFGENGGMLQLLPGGFLQYGTELSGMMVFSQDETAVYDPAAGDNGAAAPAAPAAPETPAAAGRTFSSYEEYMDIKFVARSYTAFGTEQDASTLGAEYAVTFHANGTCDFTLAGMANLGLTWGLQEVATGLTKTDAFVINYYGVTYNCIPTETGFDMDFYGTMNLHFVPAE